MKTLESIIEKEIRARIDDNEICKELVVSASGDPEGYDAAVELATEITEKIIRNNFDMIIELAVGFEPEEEEEEAIEQPFSENVAEEDQDMLRFLME